MAQIGTDENAVVNPSCPEVRALHCEVVISEVQPVVIAQLG